MAPAVLGFEEEKMDELPMESEVQPGVSEFTVRASILVGTDVDEGKAVPVIKVEILTVTGTLVLFAKPDDALHAFGPVVEVAERMKRALIIPPVELPDHPEDN